MTKTFVQMFRDAATRAELDLGPMDVDGGDVAWLNIRGNINARITLDGEGVVHWSMCLDNASGSAKGFGTDTEGQIYAALRYASEAAKNSGRRALDRLFSKPSDDHIIA